MGSIFFPISLPKVYRERQTGQEGILKTDLDCLFFSQSPWFWDTRQCWHSYPYQPLTSGLYYYYIMELAFYWSLMFSQFTDIKRKDFLIMFVHHLATIGLITFSYINNMVRVGTLVLCLHDVSDFLLEAAKLANYAKYQRLCDTLFVIFSAVFVVTRLGIYPFQILNTTLFESWEMIGPYPSWWLFNGLLLVLQVLHVIWSYLIARIAFKALIRGKVRVKDGFFLWGITKQKAQGSNVFIFFLSMSVQPSKT